MAISCSPNDLAAAAKCFTCLSPVTLREIKTYLLCQLAGLQAPANFIFFATVDGLSAKGTWATPPSGVTKTEVWVSTNGINFVLQANVVAPTAFFTMPAPLAPTDIIWMKVRYCTATMCGPFTDPQPVFGYTSDWTTRVQGHGGGAPSQANLNSINGFVWDLFKGSILGKMIAVNVFAPDNLVAALSPIFIGTGGLDPWTNVNFVAGDLTINGLKGNIAGGKVLDTGIVSTAVWNNTAGNINAATSGGISAYNFDTAGATTGFDISAAANLASGEIGLAIIFTPTAANTLFFDFADSATGRLAVLNTGWTGFTSCSRVGPADSEAYKANSVTPFANIGSDLNNRNGSAMPTVSFACFGYKTSGGVLTANSERRLSFAAIHFGLTATDTQNLFNAVQKLRVAFGGGFI